MFCNFFVLHLSLSGFAINVNLHVNEYEHESKLCPLGFTQYRLFGVGYLLEFGLLPPEQAQLF